MGLYIFCGWFVFVALTAGAWFLLRSTQWRFREVRVPCDGRGERCLGCYDCNGRKPLPPPRKPRRL